MAVAKAPAFQFYPQDYLSSARVAEMTLEEEGVYIRLLCYCWSSGSIPADPERCARLAGKGCSVAVATTVQRAFNEDPTDSTRLVHDRLEFEREKQQTRREQASEAGKKSAAARAEAARNGSKKTGKTSKSNDRSTTVQPESNPSSSSSSSSSDIKKHNVSFSPPTVGEVAAYCDERGNSVDPDAFVDFYTSKGWLVGKTKMKDWRAAVRTWEKQGNSKHDNRSTTKPTASQQREQATASAFDRIRAAAAAAAASGGNQGGAPAASSGAIVFRENDRHPHRASG